MTTDSDNTYPEAFGYMSKAGIPSNLFTEVIDNDKGDLHCKCIFCENVDFTISVPKDYFYCFNCNARGKWEYIRNYVIAYLYCQQEISRQSLLQRKYGHLLKYEKSEDKRSYENAIREAFKRLDTTYTECCIIRAKACLGDYLISCNGEFFVNISNKRKAHILHKEMTEIAKSNGYVLPDEIFSAFFDEIYCFNTTFPLLVNAIQNERCLAIIESADFAIRPK